MSPCLTEPHSEAQPGGHRLSPESGHSPEAWPGDGVVILGGGVCGLYAGLTLAEAGVPVTVLEKRTEISGLARGCLRLGNFYDLGVHMLHSFDKEVFEKVVPLMGKDAVKVVLDAKIRWGDGHYRYPLQFADLLRKMPWRSLVRCVSGLAWATISQRFKQQSATNAEQALTQLYGRALYRYFFRDFTTRYWGIKPCQLSATFVHQKMPRFTALDIIRKLLGYSMRPESPLQREILHYAKSGAEALPRSMTAHLEALGGRVLTEAQVIRIEFTGNRIDAVHFEIRGEQVRLPCLHCLSTIPLAALVKLLGASVPPAVEASAAKLLYKPMVVFGFLIRKERVLDALYVYFRERCFHRVGEPKNAGMLVTPSDHTVLIVEMTCERGDARWQGEGAVIDKVITDLAEEGICQPEDIVETHHFQKAHAYPIYDLGFEAHLEQVQAFLKEVSNLESTGRQGGFCYPNMHTSMRMGGDAAERARQSLFSKTS